MGLYNRKIKS